MKVGDEKIVWIDSDIVRVEILSLFTHDGDKFAVVKSNDENCGFYYGDIDIFSEESLAGPVDDKFFAFKDTCAEKGLRYTDKDLYAMYMAGMEFHND